jgi:hypothetical protein
VRLEGLGQLKNPMASLGIEHVTPPPPLALLISQYSDVSIITFLMCSAFSIVMSVFMSAVLCGREHNHTLHCGHLNFVFISLFYMEHAQCSIHLPSKGRFSCIIHQVRMVGWWKQVVFPLVLSACSGPKCEM